MGKSDPHVFEFYARQLPRNMHYKNVAFFGQPKDNLLSNFIKADKKYFYDLSLKNWEINTFPYEVDTKFDLIVCTRCAYFSKNPMSMIEQFEQMLNLDAILLIDWGLGDHWRFDNYKVGWVRSGVHEWAYEKDNFLWSCYLSKKMKSNKQFEQFENSVKKFGYKSVADAINIEVPSILTDEKIKSSNLKVLSENYLFLWPDSPQFYTSLLLTKE
jgi:hypothetical protein